MLSSSSIVVGEGGLRVIVDISKPRLNGLDDLRKVTEVQQGNKLLSFDRLSSDGKRGFFS